MSKSRDKSEHGDEGEMLASHWEFDVDQSAPGVDVVEVIAELEECQSTDLSVIYDTIDHLIERLFSSPPPPEAQARLEFTYEGYRIVLNQDGYATFMKIGE